MPSAGESVLLRRGFLVGAAVTKNRFVKIGAAVETVIQTALSNDVSIGVAETTVTTAEFNRGKGTNVKMAGIVLMEAGAAVALGAEVMSDTSGRAITAVTATNRACGVALKAASGAGDFIPVLLNLPGRII